MIIYILLPIYIYVSYENTLYNDETFFRSVNIGVGKYCITVKLIIKSLLSTYLITMNNLCTYRAIFKLSLIIKFNKKTKCFRIYFNYNNLM